MQNQFLTLHGLFEAQVKSTPHNPALVYSKIVSASSSTNNFYDFLYSYQELNELANQLAYFLQEQGIGKEDVVAIALDKSVYVFAIILACSKLGAVFLLLDHQFPNERINFIVQDAQAKLVIGKTKLLKNLNGSAATLSLKTLEHTLTSYPKANLDKQVSASDPAYIIYTSGTTGKPKGALLEHKGLSNWHDEIKRLIGLTPADRILQFAPLSFDPVIWDLLKTISAGACLYITPMAVCLDPLLLNEYIHSKGITGLTVTPEVLSWLQPEKHCPLKFVVSTGAAFKSQYVQKLHANKIKTFNAYGPSETTIGVSIQEVLPSDLAGVIPVGKAIANTKFYILDQEGQPVSDGEEGEIGVGGMLARSYLNNEALTQAKFIENPVVTDRQQFPRIYKTGDIGYLQPDNTLIYLGRYDNQVKIYGKRIELEEIQRVLLQHEQLLDAYITAFTNDYGQKKIVAYLVAKKSLSNEETLLSWPEYCKKQLPFYMIPWAFMPIDALPLNSHGKVDEKLLPKPMRPKKTNQTDCNNLKNEIELKLESIWLEILDNIATELQLDDDFLSLGGDSVSISMLQAKIKSRFDVQCSTSSLHKHNTLQSQAIYIGDRLSAKVLANKKVRLYSETTGQDSKQIKHQRSNSPELQPLPPMERSEGSLRCSGIFDYEEMEPVTKKDFDKVF